MFRAVTRNDFGYSFLPSPPSFRGHEYDLQPTIMTLRSARSPYRMGASVDANSTMIDKILYNS